MDEQKELLRKNHDKLISKTVTVDDIFASVNYLNNLGHGLGTTDDIDHLGNPPHPQRGRAFAKPVPHWLFAHGARHS